MMDENEAWDDTVPNWATSAHLTQGVSWEPDQPGAKPATQHASAHGAPSFGFSRATSLQQTGGWVQPVAEDGPDMRYEATAMGERVTQLYLIRFQPPFSAVAYDELFVVASKRRPCL